MMRIFFCFLFLPILAFLESAQAKPLKTPIERPKLLIVLVVDQMRSDYLTRFDSRFLPAKGASGVGGFKFLTSQGAYFPNAEYDVLQSMTCPGHAMIMSGAHPIANGIILNDWYDKVARKSVYCASDSEDGLSPRNLKTTTVGDELKNAGYKSKVVGISLKDRSAIMLAGHRGDSVFWFDSAKYEWATSTYYSPKAEVPDWVTSKNSEIKKSWGEDYIFETKTPPSGLSENNDLPFVLKSKIGDRNTLALPYGVKITLDLAEAAITNLKLGKNGVTDILAISLSSHDALGHRYGPNSREMEEMTVFEDQALAKFFNFLQKKKLLEKSVIVLTADHGIAPTPEYTKKAKIDGGKIEYLPLFKRLNSHLDKKFGRPKNNQWIVNFSSLNFYFDRETLAEKRVDLADAEREAKQILLDEPGVWYVMSSSDYRKGLLPPGEIGQQILRQYSIEQSGDLIIVPRPFFMDGGESTTTHLTGYTYDRMVPLVIFGKGIQPGAYPVQAKILDIAPTLAFILGIIPPANSHGKILEIF